MRMLFFFVSADRRTASSASTHRYYHTNQFTKLVIMAVLLLAVVSQVIGAEPVPILPPIPEPVPPPPPDVPPLISQTYSNDEDGNHIQDKLELRVGPPRRPIPSPLEPPVLEMVDVQLTFSAPITQQQIDDFLGIGGEITYIYKAISYGWSGRIPESLITLLPDLMGPTMVIVEEPPTDVLDMDVATQTGRVRPIWRARFAGNPLGFDGDESITIGIIDSGIDASHPDLAGRQAYWRDFSAEAYLNPIDIIQHGTHVAGVALGTGRSNEGIFSNLYYTEIGNLQYTQENRFLIPYPIQLSPETHTFTSRAEWTGGGETLLYHVSRPKGNMTDWSIVSGPVSGQSGLFLSSTINGSDDTIYATALLSTGGSVRNFVITNSVSTPRVPSEYFSKFRGVAPECRWAAAKSKWSHNDKSWSREALMELSDLRIGRNVKIVNISLSITSDNGVAETYRQEVNSAVNKGVLVVISAGNNGREGNRRDREISDPGRAEMALTVGACNDENKLTDYSSQGLDLRPSLFEPEPSPGVGYKPDLIAPGGSRYHTGIMSVDSGSGDGPTFDDKQANDYYNIDGTSMASPFAAGCAALVIDAMQQKGIQWDFYSSNHPRYVKMVLCATATETGANRENGKFNPTLQRAANGPNGFPPGKDRYEGYGIINPDAAVESVYLTYEWGTEETGTLGSDPYDRRAWARTVRLSAGHTYNISLDISPTPSGGIFEDEIEDFDLYLYSAEPSRTGTPVIIASSTAANGFIQPGPRPPIPMPDESIGYTATDDADALLVIKRISGSGDFTLKSSMRETGPVGPVRPGF